MKRYAIYTSLFLVLLFMIECKHKPNEKKFIPVEIWKDTDGNPINAHGGGILDYEGKYYWFGELKNGKTWRVGNKEWEDYRCNAGGISCYSSENLIDWKFEGIALMANTTDSANDLHISKVLERPKVIYNEKTKKFVMWLHIDTEDYSYARAGMAVSDKPQGPIHFWEALGRITR